MTPPADAAARVLDKPEERESTKTGRIIYLSEKDFTWDQERKASWEDAEREFKDRTATKGKLDAGRTVRSGLAYDFDSTAPIPPSNAERAARVKAELGDEPLHGIENRPVYRFVKRTFDIAFSAAVLVAFSWLYLLIAILVKVDDPKGPVFFKQERVGWSIIGQKSGVVSGYALRPALSALKVFSSSHSRLRLGVAA